MRSVPRPGELNELVLDELRAMAVGGGYRFEPGPRALANDNPRDPGHDGVRRPLVVGGATVALAAADGATYCCGVTLEVFWRAWLVWSGGRPPVPTAEAARALVADWFCPSLGHAGAAAALVSRGLGVGVPPAEAEPGDLCQLWRDVDPRSASGHSVVFLAWPRPGVLRYWSSQRATDGVGVHTEEVGPDWALHFARVGVRTPEAP